MTASRKHVSAPASGAMLRVHHPIKKEIDMSVRFAWLAALALCLAACSGKKDIEGFKEIKFGSTEATLVKLGFECSAATRQCKQPNTPSVATLLLNEGHLAAADVQRGAQAWSRCSACHTVDRRGANGIGPNLWSIIGDDIGSPVRGFAYSRVLTERQGRWDVATLDALLADPRTFAPGTKMTSGPLTDPQMRADIISYLNSKSEQPNKLTIAARHAVTASPSAAYTLFGKTGSVTIDLGKDGVEAISVGVGMPADQLTELFAEQYGDPLSFTDTDAFGGRLTRFYWRFESGNAIIVTRRETKGPLQPQVPAWLAVDETNFSSALYLAPDRATRMLSRAKGNQIDSSDL